MPNSDLDLDAIRARLAVASEGPWRTHDTDLGTWGGHTATVLGPERREPGSRPGWDRITTEGIAWLPTFEGSPRAPQQNPWNNAAFIAGAREDVPALLAEVERLRRIEATAQRFVDGDHSDDGNFFQLVRALNGLPPGVTRPNASESQR